MKDSETKTKEKILNAGKKEFSQKGFRGASLRNIVKEAGVTTGAFYGYYKSKEELFSAIVGQVADTFMETFLNAQNSFAKLPPEIQPENMGKISGDCMEWEADYIFEHKDIFRLILTCGEGTEYENFIDDIVEIEVKSTLDFINVLKNTGHKVRKITPQFIHIIASGMFTAFFEIAIHDMEYETAMEYVKMLREFHTSGWSEILGVDCGEN